MQQDPTWLSARIKLCVIGKENLLIGRQTCRWPAWLTYIVVLLPTEWFPSAAGIQPSSVQHARHYNQQITTIDCIKTFCHNSKHSSSRQDMMLSKGHRFLWVYNISLWLLFSFLFCYSKLLSTLSIFTCRAVLHNNLLSFVSLPFVFFYVYPKYRPALSLFSFCLHCSLNQFTM